MPVVTPLGPLLLFSAPSRVCTALASALRRACSSSRLVCGAGAEAACAAHRSSRPRHSPACPCRPPRAPPPAHAF
eukprot:1874198-Rhodomonas_salina.1